MWFTYLKSLGIFLVILSLIPIGFYLYKKLTVKKLSKGMIKILEIRPVSYKAQLLLIEVKGRIFLIGLSDKGFDYLGEIGNDVSGSATGCTHHSINHSGTERT